MYTEEELHIIDRYCVTMYMTLPKDDPRAILAVEYFRNRPTVLEQLDAAIRERQIRALTQM